MGNQKKAEQDDVLNLEELSYFLGGANPNAVLETVKNNPDMYSPKDLAMLLEQVRYNPDMYLPEDVAWLEEQVNNLESKGMKR